MTNYWVSWEINIEADTPKKAAEIALQIHRDKSSIATVFFVEDTLTNERLEVDLEDI